MIARKTVSHLCTLLFVIVFVMAFMPLQPAHAAGPRYVKVDGTGDCSSWDNACTLQSALSGATAGDEIWVAEGTYVPTTDTTDRTATFQLVDGVAVYGGFAGTETGRDQRDPQAHVTVLSGDIDDDDSQTPVITDLSSVSGNTTNSYHVVSGSTGSSPATLDGFTITAGFADGSDLNTDNGAGMLNLTNGPVLSDLIFSGNVALNLGGGLYNTSSDSPTLLNITFNTNWAEDGGGMYTIAGTPALTNVTFSGNTAVTNGGGLYNGDNGSPTLKNVTFSGNSADNGGGIFNYTVGGAGFMVYSVTLVGNSANTSGGGLFNDGHLQIYNTIFWANTAGDGMQIYNNPHFDSGEYIIPVRYSIVEGGCPVRTTCTNLVTVDPQLGSISNYGGLTQTFPLLPGSSAINSGNDVVCPFTDQRGAPRPQGAHCDIGAYEFQTVLLAVPGGMTSGLCQSWAQACELRYVLAGAAAGREIWVKAGTYTPGATPTDRSATFQLIGGVAVYGGFVGTETARNQRDYAAHATILSGDIDNDDSQKPVITNLATVTGNTTNSFHVVAGASGATLDGFTITAGYADGVGINPGVGAGMYNIPISSPTVANVIFSGNAAMNGGGMGNNGSSPSLTDVTFTNNTAQSQGGGMYNINTSNPVLAYVSFEDNAAQNGGGMYNDSSSPHITDSTFTGNTATYTAGATGYGGGMNNNALSSPILTNVTFSENSAYFGGGMLVGSGSPILTNVTFSKNTALAGGGMGNNYSSSVLLNVNFIENSATYGGGMYNSHASPSMTGGSFSGNMATKNGGGVFNEGADSPSFAYVTFSGNAATGTGSCTLTPCGYGGGMITFSGNPTLTDVIFINNAAALDGGGMANKPSLNAPGVSHSNLNRITFSGNTAGRNGGGYYNLNLNDGASSAIMKNVTFSGNSAAGNGGGMYNEGGATTLTNLTFSGNSAANGGGIAVRNSGSLNIRNTILWGNTAVSSGAQLWPDGSTPTVSDSIVQDGFAGGTRILTVDPKLATLGNYGGYSRTIPIGMGTAALDTGNDSVCPATDQRGVTRPQSSHCDIGAYEVDAPVLMSITPAANPTQAASAGFTISFSKPVTGVDGSDFTFTTTGLTGASITGLSGGPATYTLTVNTGSGNGSMRLDLNASGTGIQDLSGSPIFNEFTGNIVWVTKTAPVLITPTDAEALLYNFPTFDWSEYPAAIGFQLQVSKLNLFGTTVLNVNTIPSTFTAIVSLPPNLPLFWRVRAKLTATTYSGWSEIRKLTSANPPSVATLVTPASNALVIGYKPLLDWSIVKLPTSGPGFGYYQVQVAETADFASLVIDDTSLTNIAVHQFTPAGALNPNTRYYWRVRAVNSQGQYNAWSVLRSFRTAILPPETLAPGNETLPAVNLNTRRPTFSWNAVTGASGYVVEVSTGPGFGSKAINVTLATAVTSYIHTADLAANTVYYWRLKATGANGPSLYSQIRIFKTGNPPGTPSPAKPASNALVTIYRPKLDWPIVALPSGTDFRYYRIQVADNLDFASPVIDDSTSLSLIIAHEFTPPTDLNPNTKYYWRVQAVNFNTALGENNFSAWSLTRSFRSAMRPPNSLAPGNETPAAAENLTTRRPTFSWNAVTGASGYVVEVSTIIGFGSKAINATLTTPATAYTHTADLAANTVYYWRVKANGVNGPSLYSQIRTFRTGNPPAAPGLVAPADNALVNAAPLLLDWSNVTVPASTGFVRYRVQVATDAAFTAPTFIDDISHTSPTDSSLTTPALVANTKYYWRVMAVNLVGSEENYSAWSLVRTFRAKLNTPTPILPVGGGTVGSLKPVFSWSAVPGTTGYTIQVSKSTSFATLLVNATLTTPVTTYTPTANLPAKTTLYWRVRANGANGPGDWMVYATFKTP